MDMIKIEGTLPVALTVGTVKSKKVLMRQMTVKEALDTTANLKAGDYTTLGELAAMTVLVDDNGDEHALRYDHLANASRQVGDYLNVLRGQLDAKEQAES